jgi:biotin carboxyl carrier protein
MKKIVKILIVVVIVAALAILGMKAVKAKRAREASAPVATIYPVVVKKYIPYYGKVELTLPYLATVINEEDVTLASRLSGRVEMIKKSGETVSKGDIVARVDTTELQAKIDSARIALENLLKSHARTKALYRVKGASIEQLQKEESQIAALKAQITALKNQMAYATLRSPVSGVIAKSFETEGSIVMPGKPLVKISAQKGFSLLVRTPDSVAPKALRFMGKRYTLHPLGTTYHGLNEYKAFVDVTGLTAGDRVDVHVTIFDAKATLLPFDTLLSRDREEDVLVITQNHATAKKVHILQSGEEGVAVADDLDNDALVLAKPDILLKLLSGYRLKIKEQ